MLKQENGFGSLLTNLLINGLDGSLIYNSNSFILKLKFTYLYLRAGLTDCNNNTLIHVSLD